MAFNIANFASKINGTGLAKNNLFYAAITSPPSMNLPIESDLMFLCKSASIPGLELETTAIKPQGWGRTDLLPTAHTKPNLTMTFMVDSNFAVKQYFHRWMQTIMNYNDSKGPNSEGINGKLPYEFDYRNNYAGEIDIVVFSEHDSSPEARAYTYKFKNAYPITVSGVETAWENQAEIMSITTLMTYTSMSVSGMSDTEISNRPLGPITGTATGGGFNGGLTGGISNLNQSFLAGGTSPVNIQGTIDEFLSPINRAITQGNDLLSSLNRLF